MKNEQVPDSQQTGNEKNPDGGELGRVMIDGMRVYSRVLGYIKSAQRRCSRKIDSSTVKNSQLATVFTDWRQGKKKPTGEK